MFDEKPSPFGLPPPPQRQASSNSQSSGFEFPSSGQQNVGIDIFAQLAAVSSLPNQILMRNQNAQSQNTSTNNLGMAIFCA